MRRTGLRLTALIDRTGVTGTMQSMKGAAMALACAFAASAVTGYAIQSLAAETTSARDALRSCVELGTGQSTACAEALMPGLLRKHSVAEVNDALLQAVAEVGSKGAPSCHGMSEAIGSEWARQVGIAALDDLQYSCLGGPMHGVFYQLGRTTPARQMARLSVGLCEDFGDGKPWVVGWDCRHGVGHALGLDAATSAEQAFALCADVYAVPSDQDDCGTGVMGSLLSREKDRPRELSADPWAWCRSRVAASMQPSCLTRSAFIALQSGRTLPQVARACTSSDLTCAYAVGYAAGTPYQAYSARQRVEPCLSFPLRAGQEACVAGLIRNITPDYWLLEQDTGLCRQLAGLRDACADEVQRMRQREMTIRQLTGQAPARLGDLRDPAGWPRSQQPGVQ